MKWYPLMYKPSILQYLPTESENDTQCTMFCVIPKMETTYVLAYKKIGTFPLYFESAVKFKSIRNPLSNVNKGFMIFLKFK